MYCTRALFVTIVEMHYLLLAVILDRSQHASLLIVFFFFRKINGYIKFNIPNPMTYLVCDSVPLATVPRILKQATVSVSSFIWMNSTNLYKTPESMHS